MRKKTCVSLIFVLAVLLLSLVFDGHSGQKELSTGEKVFTKYGVQLQEVPGQFQEDGVFIPKDTLLIIVRKGNGWLEVENENGNFSGWVAEKWVSKEKVAPENDGRKAYEKYTDKEVDEFNGITWYSNNKSRLPQPYIGSYIGVKESNIFLRMIVKYYGEKWLFVQSFSVMVDGKKYGPFKVKFQRDHDSDVWEWCDVYVEKPEYQMLKAIAKSKKTLIRFTGRQYHTDHEVTQYEKQLLNEIFLSYESLGGKTI